MKKSLCILLLLAGKTLFAQNDLSVISISAPASGCSLTATENVTIRIFNYGSTLPAATSFNVSYTINGGGPVIALATLASPLTSNSTLNYTFAIQANLSTPGAYTFTASVTIAGDVSPANDGYSGYVVVNTAASVGGTVSGGTNVCVSGNSGVLTLSGHTGSVIRWEYSTDGGSTWVNISNTTTTQSYSNLTTPTLYRAVIQNGACSIANSSAASMTINPATVGGSIAGGATVCSGSNSGTLTLSSHTGNIIRWEYSTDGGSIWNNISNTTTSQPYTNIAINTLYRALVQNASCVATTSSVASMIVSSPAVGGSISGPSTASPSNNSGTLTLSGYTGSIVRWEYSTDGGSIWNNIANTGTTQSYSGLSVTTQYRAVLQGCTTTQSAVKTVTVLSSNQALGYQAFITNTTGTNNVAYGYRSLYNNSTGNSNVSLGAEAGLHNTGSGNIFLGAQSGADENGDNKLYIGNATANTIVYGDMLTGQLLLGNKSPAGYAFQGTRTLNVLGGIISDSVRVALSGSWSDYVFNNDYALTPLSELGKYIKTHHHLPGVPTATEVAKDGIDLAAMNAKLLEKIEELTLYILQQQKEKDVQQEKLDELKSRLDGMEKILLLLRQGK
jgi:hypothetical protein